MITHPFPGLDQRALQRRILICLVAFLAVGAVMLVLEQALLDRGAGIVELEFTTADQSAAVLADWGAACGDERSDCPLGDVVWRAKAIVLLDFVFLAAYGIGGAAILASLSDRRRDRRPWVPRTLGLLAWAMLAAAVLDGAENAALWQVLVLHPNGFAEAATALASAKFTLIAGVVTATPVILIAGRRPVPPRPPATMCTGDVDPQDSAA